MNIRNPKPYLQPAPGRTLYDFIVFNNSRKEGSFSKNPGKNASPNDQGNCICHHVAFLHSGYCSEKRSAWIPFDSHWNFRGDYRNCHR